MHREELPEDVASVAGRYETLLDQFSCFEKHLDSALQQLAARYPRSFSKLNTGEPGVSMFRCINTFLRLTAEIGMEDGRVYAMFVFDSVRDFQRPGEDAVLIERIVVDADGNVLFPDSACNITEPSAVRLIHAVLSRHIKTNFLKIGALKMDLAP